MIEKNYATVKPDSSFAPRGMKTYSESRIEQRNLRRLERVFRCYIVRETMEDYKEGCLMVWANYMSPCNSIVGIYFKGT